MWDTENEKSEELPISSGEQQQSVILQSPNGNQQPPQGGETPPQHVSVPKIEGKTEGGTGEMMEALSENQNALMTCQMPSKTLISDGSDPLSSCPTVMTERLPVLKQDCGPDVGFCETDAKPDPDFVSDSDLKGLSSFSCQHCQKRFRNRQDLERHIRASTTCRSQTFKCRHCRKCFRTQFGRRRHERRHDNMHRRTGGLTISSSLQGEGESPSSQEGDKSRLTSPVVTQSPMPGSEKKGVSDEGGQTRCSFVCKYCKKAFGTHTNLRRHERRIHERRLLPRAVCQKVKGVQKFKTQQPGDVSEISSATSTHGGKEAEPEEGYMVDISSNISENLSFYIDGKIISTSAVTNCEVMEVNSASAAVIGLDTLIISPDQITQAFKIDSNDCNMTSDICGQPSGRRRTSTPPLLPQIKTELESESILTSSSPSSQSTLIGTVLPQPLETIVLQKEKMIYLSPKLKQLLQNQDSRKSTFALITESNKLCTPLSLAVLPAATSRFKRRTTSPPSSSQQSNVQGVKNSKAQDGVSLVSKEPNIESDGSIFKVTSSPEKEEKEAVNATTNDGAAIQQASPMDCSTSETGGRPCNQQPLDLSSTAGKRDSEVLAESVLDLSTSKKNTESDSVGGTVVQTTVKKTKPNSSMLEKVLLNQYAGVDVPIMADAGIQSTPVASDLTLSLSQPDSANSERVVFELSLPSPAEIQTTPLPSIPTMLHTAPQTQLPSVPALCTPLPTEFFPSVPTTMPNQELHNLCSTTQSSIPVVPTTTTEVSVDSSVSIENSFPAFNVALPTWLNSAPGVLTHALIPTTASLNLQGSQFLTNPPVCEVAQRTLVVDSVLSPEAQIFSPSLTVNQSNITSLSFPPNVVVIEYMVALESSDGTPVLQANTVHSVHTPPGQTEQGEHHPFPQPQTATIDSFAPELPQAGTTEPLSQDISLHPSTTTGSFENPPAAVPSTPPIVQGGSENKLETTDSFTCSVNPKMETSDNSMQDSLESELPSSLPPLCKRFICNACDESFQSMKSLSRHIREHSDTWPYKCEFCVQLFESDKGLLEHRSNYHGIGKIYVCKLCSKEFAFLCNLEQHHRDLHPGHECSHTEVENGKLRPENHNSPAVADSVLQMQATKEKNKSGKLEIKIEADNDSDNTSEELYTTIKIMASEAVKPKGADVRLGINQHYPSFKPPPFPYHNRTSAATTTATTATNFTTHNIPQTFSTAIRCTKCGKSFVKMTELHKHILACANASDKKRYTPKKNPIPLKQFAKSQNGVLSPARGVNSRQNVSQRFGQLKRPSCHETTSKVKLSTHSRKKPVWLHRGRPVGRKGPQEELEVCICRHCSREFTYHTSLKKHMAVSCPMKPVYKKAKKRKCSIAPAQENNGTIHTHAADVIMKPRRSDQGQKTLTKTEGSEFGSAHNASLPLKTHTGKGKFAVHNFRSKRSDILSTSAGQIGKKREPIPMEGIQPSLSLSKSPAMQGKSQQTSNRLQVMGREIRRKEMEVKAQARAGELLSLRGRERTGGPITRSLQQSNIILTSAANTTNIKANTTSPATSPIQIECQNIMPCSAVTESKK